MKVQQLLKEMPPPEKEVVERVIIKEVVEQPQIKAPLIIREEVKKAPPILSSDLGVTMFSIVAEKSSPEFLVNIQESKNEEIKETEEKLSLDNSFESVASKMPKS